jgi:hypothetical protein
MSTEKNQAQGATGNKTQDVTNSDDVQATKSQTTLGDNAVITDTVDKASLEKILADRRYEQALSEKRSANKEAKDLKERLAVLEKQEEDRKLAEMDEVEKANALAKQTTEENALLKLQIAASERRTLALESGVKSEYTDYFSQELAKAQEDPELDVAKWFEAKKEALPAFFGGGNGQAPIATGTGGPHRGASKAAEIQVLEEKKAKLQNNFSSSAAVERVNLFNQIEALKRGETK